MLVKEDLEQYTIDMSVYPLHLYLKRLPVLLMLGVAGILNLAAWIEILVHIHPSATPIFLHYNILFGIDEIGPWSDLLWLPIGGAAIIVVNAAIGWLMFAKERCIEYILLAMSVLIEIHLLIAAFFLVSLNV